MVRLHLLWSNFTAGKISLGIGVGKQNMLCVRGMSFLLITLSSGLIHSMC